MSDDVESDDDLYLLVGCFAPSEARRLLPQLEKREVRFRIDVTDNSTQQMPYINVNATLPFGKPNKREHGIVVFVHRDDQALFAELFNAIVRV